MPDFRGHVWFVTLLAFTQLPAQGSFQWNADLLFAPRHSNAIAFDPVRQRVLSFGGVCGTGGGNGVPVGVVLGDTCDWDGERWLQINSTTRPSARFGHAMTTDTVRQRIVLFGGRDDNVVFRDTWEWDGAEWLQRLPPHAPSVRHDHAMTYDPVRQRGVLFGGRAVVISLGDTWEWDGQDWTLLVPPLAPMASYYNGLAYDPNLQETLLVSGNSTWSWNGTRWLQRVPAWTPPFLRQQQMATDFRRRRVVVLSGYSIPSSSSAETLEWNGSNWATSPGPDVYAGAMAYDWVRQSLLVVGGKRATRLCLSGETWEYHGMQWQSRGGLGPEPRRTHGLCVDADGVGLVLFGGNGMSNYGPPLDDTWTHDGQRWLRRTTSTGPAARSDVEMARDPLRQRVVLHGGWDGFSNLSDTWEWDGTNWQQVNPSVVPPVRSGHRLAFDSVRQRILLFGGADDQWEFDGANWSPVLVSVRPPWRRYPILVGDPIRRRVVMFGGFGPQLSYDDTWEWDGTSWHARVVAVRPPLHIRAKGDFDPVRQRVVMPGASSEHANEVWEWDGVAWQLRLAPLPDRSGGTVVCFHPALQRVVLFGGYDSDTHVWSLTDGPMAATQIVGPGCPGVVGEPRLAASTPGLVSPVLALDLHSGRSSAACVFGISLFSRPQPAGNGCTLYLDQPQLTFATTNGLGFADLRASIPLLPALRGVAIHAQAAVLDMQGTAANVAFTAALRLTLGD